MRGVSREIVNTGMAALSGAMLTAAFPKVGWDWMAWVALVPLLFSVRGHSGAHAFRLGFLAGLSHQMTLLYWVVPTMQIYGQLPLYLSGPVLFLFSAYLALYTGGFAWIAATALATSGYRLLMVPALWVAMEYLRSLIFTGFPWELAGHSQYRWLTIIQIADLAGVYGISFLVLMGNTALFSVCLLSPAIGNQRKAFDPRPAVVLVLIFLAALAGSWAYGKTRIAALARHMASADTFRVAVIQGNIDQAVKWDPAFQAATVSTYNRLSESVAPERPQLIVWPETATPFYFLLDRKWTAPIMETIRKGGAHYLIGSNAVDTLADRTVYFNSAYLVAPDGRIDGRYDKVQLVPFGEYVPLKRWLPFIGKMVEHVGDFEPGRHGSTLSLNGKKVGVLICYEIIFPGLSRYMVKNGATVLINMTNDAWYGRSSAPFQHFSMAVFRAVENRRSLVRSANTGISGFIDPAGRIIDATPLFREAAVTHAVPGLTTLSLYTRIGDIFALLCLAAAIGDTLYRLVSGRKSN